MALTIYGTARSRTSRVLWVAEELGLPYRHVPVGVTDGGTAAASFLALNPHGRVPVVEDDGVVVWESFAINLVLARRHGGPLAPRDPAEEAAVTAWTLFAATELEPHTHEVVVHTINRPPGEQEPARRDSALAALQRPLAALDRALAGGHLVGGRFTVADLNVACAIFYLRAWPPALEPFPAVAAWYRAATERPAFQRMMAMREAA